MNLTDIVNSVIAAAGAALVGFVGFLIRKILTNEKRISLLEAEIEQREKYRRERDLFLNDQLETIQSDIKRLIGKMTADYQDDK